MPRRARVDGLPANETLAHFVLEWAAYRLLTRELECPFAAVETNLGRSRLRHDAVGIRLRQGRTVPWEELDTGALRLEVLDERLGIWRSPTEAEEASWTSDTAHRAWEAGTLGEEPLRAARPTGHPGRWQVQRWGGERREMVQVCAADAKQSRGDLLAWLRRAEERLRGVHLFLLVTPPGLARPDELPPHVGLAEVDLEEILGSDGEANVRLVRWPETLRSASPWSAERTERFQRQAYYALHGLFSRQLFWLLAQTAIDHEAASRKTPADVTESSGPPGAADKPSPARGSRPRAGGGRTRA